MRSKKGSLIQAISYTHTHTCAHTPHLALPVAQTRKVRISFQDFTCPEKSFE